MAYEDDMKKLEDAFFENLFYYEGGPYVGMDIKCPFGNSNIERDILEIIEAEPDGCDGDENEWNGEQYRYARSLYGDLAYWIKNTDSGISHMIH